MTCGGELLHSARDLVVEVPPIRIERPDQVDLPLAWPVLDVLLALDRGDGGVVLLVIDERLDAVTLRETGDEALPVLVDAPDQVIRDPDIKRATGTARQDIDPEAPHDRNPKLREGCIVARRHARAKTRASITFEKGLAKRWMAGSRPARP
jgi:hypothetical protein